ncbi:MAG: SGNH/GDSL hydrolase family protein [Desulfobacterales bacterium]|nr:SGNH/GDSL hydrolase family protein [Desulfobacterales bacterium]
MANIKKNRPMTPKEKLIKKLLKQPREFTDIELNELLNDESFSAKDLRPILLKLFDKNEDTIKNDSGADKGIMGKWNRKSFRKREKLFWKRINHGKVSKLILAEGDSWFEYPKFITEIIDHLNKRKDYAINSLAYGGDWISNILFEQQYIEKLSLIKPDVFLISGGGNDIVGGKRLAQLVKKRKEIELPVDIDLNSHEGKFEFSGECFNNEFYTLLRLFRLQYKLLFKSIKLETKKFQDLKIITQGYDYAIPSSKNGFGFNIFRIARPITNYFIGNGKWLNTPLLLRGYNNRKERIAIVHGMIELFNNMIIEVGNEYENVYHIDSRGYVNERNGWYNELHPKSHEFKKIASVFEKCIESNDVNKKIYKVIEE